MPGWAEAVGIYPATILGVESSDNLALSSAVTELVTASYSPVSEFWSGEKLLQAIRSFAAPAARQQQPEAGSLKPLHPC